MRNAEQQVYIALVVVKRPAGEGQPDIDPGRWAESVLNGLGEHGVQHLKASRYAPRSAPVRTRLAREVYAALGLLCLAGATCLFYLGLK